MKALPPTDERRVRRTTKDDDEAERRRRRASTEKQLSCNCFLLTAGTMVGSVTITTESSVNTCA